MVSGAIGEKHLRQKLTSASFTKLHEKPYYYLLIIYKEMGQECTDILTFSRKTLFSYFHAMILELKHINQQ